MRMIVFVHGKPIEGSGRRNILPGDPWQKLREVYFFVSLSPGLRPQHSVVFVVFFLSTVRNRMTPHTGVDKSVTILAHMEYIMGIKVKL